MTKSALVPQFRWDTVPTESREWLRARTEHILSLTYRTACDTVRIGAALAETRLRLRRRGFLAWLASEMPFSQKTAYRFMDVAAAFGGHAACQFDKFDPTALYLLAQPGVPAAARHHAVQLADGGGRVTRAVALEVLDAHRDPGAGPARPRPRRPPGARPMRCLGLVPDRDTGEPVQCPVEFLTTPAVRLCPGCRERPPEGPVPTFTRDQLARRWEVLSGLAGECEEVRIARIDGADEDDPDALYSVSCRRPDPGDDRPRNAVRRDLYDALCALTGREETRRCQKCKADRPLSLFSTNRDVRGGRCYRCKPCEKERKALRRAAARAARAARAADPPAAGGAPAA